MNLEADSSIFHDPTLILPQVLYLSSLTIINTIPLTHREVDVISCILSGRTIKKIGDFLSISPKTVENHIRNIMLKLGCRSQERIIDFIEKSDKFILIKRYYLSLRLQNLFEIELKKIALRHTTDFTRSIFYQKEEKDPPLLLNQLAKYLNMAGLKTHLRIKQNEPLHTLNPLHTINTSASPPYPIIYNLPAYTPENREQSPNVLQSAEQDSDSILFLSLDRNSPPNVEEGSDPHCIRLAQQDNFYCLVFELLKKLAPHIPLDTHITEFNKHYENLFERSPPNIRQSDQTEPSADKQQATLALSHRQRHKKLIRIASILGLLFCLSMLYLFHPYEFSQAKSRSQNDLSSFLSQLESGPVHWNLPRQDHLFVGREGLLADLYRHFNYKQPVHSTLAHKETKSHATIINLCTGLGGIGKTQLALQYVHHTPHPYKLKAWFPADNIELLRQNYLEFSKALGYSDKILTTENAIRYVNHWLSQNPGWLLVYDNVNSYEEIAPFIPESGGHILLTTRNRHWPAKFRTLPIDVMTEVEAIHLIKSLTQRELTGGALHDSKELAKLLGYLPLALAQASAYIRQNQITISEYLTLYRNHEIELLADNTHLEGTDHAPIAVTWNINLAELTKKAKTHNEAFIELYILTVCAYLCPEKIPKSLVLDLLKETYPTLPSPELTLSKAIGQLWKRSLINSREDGSISIHRLMQVVLRSQHGRPVDAHNTEHAPLTREWYNRLLSGVYNHFCIETKAFDDHTRRRNLLPHFLSLMHHHERLWPQNPSFDFAQISNAVGLIYYLLGDYEYAKFYTKIALEKFERLSSHHEIAETLNNLGFYNTETGDIKNAKILLERSLDVYQKIYGPDASQSARTMSNLGRVYRELGDTKKGKMLLESALSFLKKSYGENDLSVAITLKNLGDVYWDLNNKHYRKSVLKNALNILENNYGKNHPEVAKLLINLSEAYGDFGDYQQKKIMLERALRIEEQHYGKTHPETAKAITNLGNAYRLLGDAKQAKALLEEALQIKEKQYEMHHPEIAKTLHNLGDAYRDLGNANRAKELHERALAFRIQYYGDHHPEVAKTLNCLGNDFGFLGQPEQQKALSMRALKIQKEYYGTFHPEIADTISNLGYAYRALGDSKKSKTLQLEALEIKKQHFGLRHPEVAKTMASLGDVYGDLGEPAQKKILLEQALKIGEEYYGPDHPLVAKILTSLGDTHRDLGDLKQAKTLLVHALKIREHHYGVNHPEVAKTLISLGDANQDSGDLRQAKKLHTRTLKIREFYYGAQHPEVAKILTTLGKVYFLLGDLTEAHSILNRALTIKEQFYGTTHPEVAKTLLNLVQVYIKLQRHSEAQRLARRCYLIFSEAYKEEHYYTKKILAIMNTLNSIDKNLDKTFN